MQRNAKKGFTIVELVIVIAVIAILAAVLIPTFASLISKAQTAGDIQMVRNLNVIAAAEAALSDGELSPHRAIVAAGESGYLIEKITPTSEGRTIVWDAANYRFALLDEDGTELYPKDEKSGTPKGNMFVISNTYPAPDYDGYAVYLTEGYTGGYTLNVTTGVDTGDNELITQIIYTGTDEVAIRGNEHTAIQVDSGEVHHYDTALTAYVNGGEYIEHGTLLLAQSEGTIPDAAGFAGGDGTQENPYLIATAEQMKNIAKYNSYQNPDGTNGGMYYGDPYYFKMLDDIHYKTDEWGAIAQTISGEFDGNGHTLTVDAVTMAFQYSEGNATIKNLNFQQKTATDNANSFSMLIGYIYGNTTFENVTISSDNSSGMVNAQQGCNAFTMLVTPNASATYKNCVNEANWYFQGNGGGIFIGNMAYKNSTLYFENCVNTGLIQGNHIGFFYPNLTQSSSIVQGVDYGDFTMPAGVNKNLLTVKNCRNEGVMIGQTACDPVGTVLGIGAMPEKGDVNVLANQKLLSNGFFTPGTMVVSNVEVSLKVSGDKIMINPAAGADHYQYRLEVMTHLYDENGEGMGNDKLYITMNIDKTETDTWNFQHVTGAMLSTKYDETASTKYADLPNKKLDDQRGIEYAIVSNGDNTYSVIVNAEQCLESYINDYDKDVSEVRIYGGYHWITAYSGDNLPIGINQCHLNELSAD